MQASSQLREDQVPSSQPHFPFLKLPREIRDAIYELVLEIYAEFYLRDLHDPWSHTPKGFCLPSLSAPFDAGSHTDSHVAGSGLVLLYRFYLFHASMMTCKQIKAEARDTFHRLVPRTHFHLRARIRDEQVTSESPLFLGIFTRSTLIFGVSRRDIKKFVSQPNRDVLRFIRDIVFVETPVSHQSPLTAWLPQHRFPAFFPKDLVQGMTTLPNLQTVSINFPRFQSRYDIVYMHTCLAMCKMVLERQIEAVRYLCPNPTAEPPIRLLPFLTNQRAPMNLSENLNLQERRHSRSRKLVYIRENKTIFDAEVVIRIMLAECDEVVHGGHELWQVELAENNVYF